LEVKWKETKTDSRRNNRAIEKRKGPESATQAIAIVAVERERERTAERNARKRSTLNCVGMCKDEETEREGE
jgi:hypothetical protein